MFVDSHAHLTFEGIDGEAMVERALEAGVEAMVNICTGPEELKRGVELAGKFPSVFNVGSTTPHDVGKDGEADFEVFAEAARSGKLVAVGETGLDYHYEHSPKAVQKDFLRRYFALAKECGLPVVIHCRDAFADFFEILDEAYEGPGVLHCFTGTLEEAKEVIKRGWYLSLSGIVTFKRSEELREVAKWVPLDHLLIETDTPYLAPQKYRGQTNEPAYVIEVAKCISTMKELPLEEVARATANNACSLFKLS